MSAVDTDTLHAVKTTRFPVATVANTPLQALARLAVPSAQAKGAQSGSVLTPDGRMLYVLGFQGLFSLLTADLALRAQQFPTWPLASMAMSTDGQFLYLLRADGPALYIADTDTGNVVRTLTPGVIPFSILHVAAPATP